MSGFELLSDQGLRLDGRKAAELRRIRCRMGVYGQADGSAYLEQGNTKVPASWEEECVKRALMAELECACCGVQYTVQVLAAVYSTLFRCWLRCTVHCTGAGCGVRTA